MWNTAYLGRALDALRRDGETVPGALLADLAPLGWQRANSAQRIVERTFVWLGPNRRLAREYEFRVGASESLIEFAAIQTMLGRIVC